MSLKIYMVVVFLSLLLALRAQQSGNVTFRLPNNLNPIGYNLTVQTYLGDKYANMSFMFNGTVRVSFSCLNATDVIVLHAKDLTIENGSLSIRSLNDTNIALKPGFTIDARNEFLILNLNKYCSRNAVYDLQISFTGKLSDNMFGFSKSEYLDSKGTRHLVASTLFESTNARKAFPCFDEPAFKAQFDVKLIRPKMYKSWSNGKLLETQTLKGDWEKDVFTRTPKMSTYLVAFVISEYKSIKGASHKYGIEVEVISRPEAIDDSRGNLALALGLISVDRFSDYFQYPYPLKKLTLASTPAYKNLAMENWGLVIFSEDTLLYKEKVDSLLSRKKVANTVVHEVAHQWFGDLVTAKWWNDVWLNEGFATWYQRVIVNELIPQFKMIEYFYVEMIPTIVLDSEDNSHPLHMTVENAQQLDLVFDSITYYKGAFICEMMSSFLGDSVFKSAVTNYLKDYQYSNADQNNLWQVLNNTIVANNTLPVNLSIKQIMDTWTLQTGYPVITIQRDNKTITLTQRKFTINPFNNDSNTRWYVPVQIKSKSAKPSQFYWLQPDQNELKIETNASDDEYIIGNYGHTGFYRVNYDDKGWDLLINEIESNASFDQLSKAQLLDDAFNLGKAQHIDQLVFLRLVKNLANETRDMPFVPANLGLDYMDFMLQMFSIYKNFKSFYQQAYGKKFLNLNWKIELLETNAVDMNIVRRMCFYGNIECLNKAFDIEFIVRSNNMTIFNDLKVLLMQLRILYEQKSSWTDIFEKYKNSNDELEKFTYLEALSVTRDVGLLRTLLFENLNDSFYTNKLFEFISNHLPAKFFLWNFLTDNWDEYINKYSNMPEMISSLIDSSLKRMNQPSDLRHIEQFVMDKGDSLSETYINQIHSSINNIKRNIAWLKRNLKSIQNFFIS